MFTHEASDLAYSNDRVDPMSPTTDSCWAESQDLEIQPRRLSRRYEEWLGSLQSWKWMDLQTCVIYELEMARDFKSIWLPKLPKKMQLIFWSLSFRRSDLKLFWHWIYYPTVKGELLVVFRVLTSSMTQSPVCVNHGHTLFCLGRSIALTFWLIEVSFTFTKRKSYSSLYHSLYNTVLARSADVPELKDSRYRRTFTINPLYQ